MSHVYDLTMLDFKFLNLKTTGGGDYNTGLLGLYNTGQSGLYNTRDLKICVWRKDRYNTRDLNILNILTAWCYSGHFSKSQPFFRAHTEVNVKNGVVKIFIGLKTSQNISKRSTRA